MRLPQEGFSGRLASRVELCQGLGCCWLVTEVLCGFFENEPGWRPQALRLEGALM